MGSSLGLPQIIPPKGSLPSNSYALANQGSHSLLVTPQPWRQCAPAGGRRGAPGDAIRRVLWHHNVCISYMPGGKVVICSACQHANEDDARFCEQCGQPLAMRCPACGTPAKLGARFCRQCGKNLGQSAEPSYAPAVPPPSPARMLALDDKLDRLQRYLPSHLSEKILASRGRLEGERKLVTVLFTDITGSTALSEQLGEEGFFVVMDELYELFIHEVHRYEGTVNELTGDGIVVFFGAPLAVEQAPQRAVRAALALQRAVARFSARLEQERGLRLQVRVGINTGPVVVGTVGNNLRMDYKAVGNTVNLAARMEQTAAPGTVQITTQ